MVTYAIWATNSKYEVRSDLWGCLEAVLALKIIKNHQKIKFSISSMSAATLLGPNLVPLSLSSHHKNWCPQYIPSAFSHYWYYTWHRRHTLNTKPELIVSVQIRESWGNIGTVDWGNTIHGDNKHDNLTINTGEKSIVVRPILYPTVH